MFDEIINDMRNDENFFKYIIIFICISVVVLGIVYYSYKSNIQKSHDKFESKFRNTVVPCTGTYTEWSSCDKSCNGQQTRSWVPDVENDTCVSKVENQSCNYCGPINNYQDLNTYYKTDKRSFNGNLNGTIVNNKSLTECGQLCNENNNCSAFSYYNNKLNMPQNKWDNSGTCQMYDMNQYKNNKLNKDGQPNWPNLISGIKIRLIQ